MNLFRKVGLSIAGTLYAIPYLLLIIGLAISALAILPLFIAGIFAFIGLIVQFQPIRFLGEALFVPFALLAATWFFGVNLLFGLIARIVGWTFYLVAAPLVTREIRQEAKARLWEQFDSGIPVSL